MSESDASKPRMALLSVSDKVGILELAQSLLRHGFRILATHNTCKLLEKSGIHATEVSEYTGYPEIIGGRVKTLHPKIFAGILFNREKDQLEAAELHIENIDIVVANLYPFQEYVNSRKGLLDSDVVELIDIGGVSLLRAAAKNFQHVTVVPDTHDYGSLVEELDSNGGLTTIEYRKRMAAKAFSVTASYDAYIQNWISGGHDMMLPDEMSIYCKKVKDLRIGENPHQRAALYNVNCGNDELPISQLHGKELSFNNIVDIEAAVAVVAEFEEPAVSIIKHCNPCGAAISNVGISDAYDKAITCDLKSSFGGIIALNKRVTLDVAEKITTIFIEAVVAPEFDEEAVLALQAKKNVRIMTCKFSDMAHGMVLKSVLGRGLLMQERDNSSVKVDDLQKVTSKEISKESMSDLLFAWKVCKHVKSNAIVVAKNGRAIGVGAGQMSRVDSVEIAIRKAGDCVGAVLASDAFFPFADSIQCAADAGISAIIQPGGSVRDKEVIDYANSRGIAMYLTGLRNFLH